VLAGNRTIAASKKKLQSIEPLCGFCPQCGASRAAFFFFHCKEEMEGNLSQKKNKI